MKKYVLMLSVAAVTAASPAFATVNVNVDIGIPAPRVVIATPPSVYFDEPPLFIAPSRLGFYVGAGTAYDIVFMSDFFYLYYGNSWHRSRHHNGPWVEVIYRDLPPVIRRHRIEEIRSYRDREYRAYRHDRDGYRGQHFRPERERYIDHRIRQEEWKDERRQDKNERRNDERQYREERKDENRQYREERKGDQRERKQHGHDRD